MDILFAVLLIAMALFSVGLTMYVVLKEKRDHDAPSRYTRTPWPQEVELPTEKTDGESLAEPVTVAEPGDHAPVSENVTPEETPKTE